MIVDGIEHGRVPVPPRSARHPAANLAHLRRPRHPRHARSLPRVGAQTRRRPNWPRTSRSRNPTRPRLETTGAKTPTQFDAVDRRPARAQPRPRRGRATRVAIADDLGDTLFVEAGAGSGKTKSLVDRVVALVRRAGCRCARSPRSRSPRRRPPSCATAIRRELEQARPAREPAADGRERAAPRSTSSTAPRSPPCTPLRSGS